MAIDTENKRRSVALMLPLADGTISANDREQVAGLYSGIDPGAASQIIGLVSAAFSSKKPSITFSSKKPGITFS